MKPQVVAVYDPAFKNLVFGQLLVPDYVLLGARIIRVFHFIIFPFAVVVLHREICLFRTIWKNVFKTTKSVKLELTSTVSIGEQHQNAGRI